MEEPAAKDRGCDPACHCSYRPDGALELLGIITRGAGIVGPGTVNVVFRKE